MILQMTLKLPLAIYISMKTVIFIKVQISKSHLVHYYIKTEDWMVIYTM